MKLLAKTDGDAMRIMSVLIAKSRHVIVDRKWSPQGVATKETFILVDATEDEYPGLVDAFNTAGAWFAVVA